MFQKCWEDSTKNNIKKKLKKLKKDSNIDISSNITVRKFALEEALLERLLLLM